MKFNIFMTSGLSGVLLFFASPGQSATLTLERYSVSATALVDSFSGEFYSGPTQREFSSNAISDFEGIEPFVSAQAGNSFATIDGSVGGAYANSALASGSQFIFAKKSQDEAFVASGSALEFVFRYEGSAPLVLEQGSFGVGGNAVLQQERGGVSSAGLAISSEWRSSSDGEFLSGGRWNQGLNCATDSWRTTCTDNQQSQTIFENNNFLEGGASAPNSFNFAFFERSPEVVLSPGGGIRILISFGVSGSGSGIGSTATANGLNSSYFDLLLPESVSFSIGDFAEQFPLGVSFVSTADSTSSPPVDNGDSSGDPSPVPLPAAAWMLLSALTGAFSIKRWSRPANGGRERSRTSS